MKVAFSDPQGTRRARLAWYAVPLAVVLFGVLGQHSFGSSFLFILLGFGLANLASLLPIRQHRPVDAEARCGPGHVDVSGAGLRSQRVRAKDVTGATTARTATGYLLTLAHRHRNAPLNIETKTEDEAEELRRALGIGHGGFGQIGWCASGGGNAAGATVSRLFLACYGIFVGGVGLGSSSEAAAVIGGVGSLFAILAFFVSLGGFLSRGSPPDVVMTAAGLRIMTPKGWFLLPYANLLDFDAYPHALQFRVPEPYNLVTVKRDRLFFGGCVGPEEERTMQAQLLSAAQRARGLGPQKPEAEGRVETLRRFNESPRDWLMRLDMAGQMLEAPQGYRGTSFDASDLWLILEDPDADTDLRAAAARVLRHSPSPQTRVRIDAAVAAVRDERASRKLRVATFDDVDAASQELLRIDQEDVAMARRAQARR